MSKSSKLGKRTHKIILLGESGVGKTSLIQRFANNIFDDSFNPTVGIDFVGKDIKYKGSVCRFQLWDTAGQQKFKSLIPTYLKDAVCAILVFDVSKPESLKNLQVWINIFRQNRKQKAISIICGNKNDLDKKFEKEDLEMLIDKYKMPYFATSAKTGNNVEEIFYKIAQMIQLVEAEKHKKKKKIEQEYEHPAMTTQSLTRHQTKEETQQVDKEIDKQTVTLTSNKQKSFHFGCC